MPQDAEGHARNGSPRHRSPVEHGGYRSGHRRAGGAAEEAGPYKNKVKEEPA